MRIKFYLLLLPLFLFSNLYSQDFDCSDCHEVEIIGVHLDAVDCADCHSDIEDDEHSDFGVEKVDCISCHDERYLTTINSDIHHRLKNVVDKPPGCISCHGSHSIVSPSNYKQPSKKICGTCHKNGKVVFTSKYHAIQKNVNACYECHEKEDYKPTITQSIHKNLNCIDCHYFASQNLEKHQDGLQPNQTANCFKCHNNIAKIHKESIHGISLAGGMEDAAMCWNCHGSHSIVKTDNPESKVNQHNIGNTCGACHDDPKFEDRHDMSVVLPGQMYSHSVHGKLVESGEDDAASCISCHGSHNIKNRVQAGSQISPVNLPNTCNKCHGDIVKEYKNSTHWMRVKKGINEAPVCNDCHSEHNIDEINNKDKKKNILHIQENTCVRCHSNKILNKKFGNSGKEVEQYLNSYHGLASVRGGSNAALCIDCHGVHSIWQKKNPASTVNKNNVTKTCRKCHEDASETFAKSYSHETESQDAKFVEDIVRKIYFWLIIIVIGGMLLHNIIIFLHELRRKRRKEKNVISIPRFTRNEVIQHLFLLTSFIALAITGFALKYPDSFWSEGLLSLGMTEAVRSTIHRVSAVIMSALSLYHLFYILFTARGRNVLYEMLPRIKDLKDVVDNMLYYLKMKKRHPHFNQYDYAEKAEYWALIWGTFVMAATGFILWFPTIIGEWAPIWLIKVSEIIHFYEAILATLAIIVWHWFFVLIHPKEYPMSFTWIDGKMSIKHYREHHENHFRKLLLEWNKYKTENIEKKKLSNFTQLFIKTVEDNGFNPDEVLQNELNTDPELFVWFENEINKEVK